MENFFLIKGQIKLENKFIDFKFGNVEYDNGEFTVELFYDQDSDLGVKLNEKNYKAYYWAETVVRGQNSKFENFELSNLHFIFIRNRPSGNCKLRSWGFLRKFPKEIMDFEIPDDSYIYHLELEGLEIEFESQLKTKESDIYSQKEFSSEFNFAYTTIPFYVKERMDDIYYKGGILITFRKFKDKESVMLLFESNVKPIARIKYEEYIDFRENLESFLGLINGGLVQIKKEYLGRYFQMNGLATEIETIYSIPKVNNLNLNNYLPVRDPFERGQHLLSDLIGTFQKYREENDKYNLTSIVRLLNDTNNAKTLNQRFYALITALETISQKHSDIIKDNSDEIIENVELDLLIKKFNVLLDESKVRLQDAKLVEKIYRDINGFKRKRKNSVYKIFKILNDKGIATNEEIDKLIKVFRHKSVHEGEFGETHDKRMRNYLLLDKLIRDILLNIIEYKGIRSKHGY